MPGQLRMGLHNILISMHLEFYAKARWAVKHQAPFYCYFLWLVFAPFVPPSFFSRLTTQKEFIVPLAFDSSSFSLFSQWPGTSETSIACKMKETVPSLEASVSIRPKLVDLGWAAYFLIAVRKERETCSRRKGLRLVGKKRLSWFLLHCRYSKPDQHSLQQTGQRQNTLKCPFFPLEVLKERMMNNLAEAVTKGAAHIRDPLGGSNATLFV